MEVEGSRGASGGMVGGTEKVIAEDLVAAGGVGPRGRVAARAAETAEVSGARGYGAVGATKVARLANAGCRAAGATKVVRLAEAGGCWAAGTGGDCRGCAHNPEVYDA